jgi:hypothetical protein
VLEHSQVKVVDYRRYMLAKTCPQINTSQLCNGNEVLSLHIYTSEYWRSAPRRPTNGFFFFLCPPEWDVQK